jgi:hypothetical protein
MGLFTYVKIDEELLPKQFRDLKDWQTKELVEPDMQELEITKEGLYYHWNEYELDEEQVERNKNKEGLFALIGIMKVKQEHTDKLYFHGDLHAHTYDRREWFELTARFTEGKLTNIKIEESEL